MSLVAAMIRLALMPPFRFTGSMRIRFGGELFQRGQIVRSVACAGTHLVVVEGNTGENTRDSASILLSLMFSTASRRSFKEK